MPAIRPLSDFDHDIQYYAVCVLAEPAGTIPLYGTDLRQKNLVAITNHRVERRDVYAGVKQICDFAHAFNRLNPEIRSALALGWWCSLSSFYLDLSLLIKERHKAIAMGQVFRQQAIGYLDKSLDYHDIKIPPRAA